MVFMTAEVIDCSSILCSALQRVALQEGSHVLVQEEHRALRGGSDQRSSGHTAPCRMTGVTLHKVRGFGVYGNRGDCSGAVASTAGAPQGFRVYGCGFRASGIRVRGLEVRFRVSCFGYGNRQQGKERESDEKGKETKRCTLSFENWGLGIAFRVPGFRTCE